MTITEEAGRILSSGISTYIADPDESCRVAESAGIKSSTMKNLDSYEKADLEAIVYSTYPKTSAISTMPQSIFGDAFGYEMQHEISGYMIDFYSGKVREEDVKNYFADCCKEMRIYRTGQRQTSGNDIEDNSQIVSQMYEIFAKENQRAARNANYEEGAAINASYCAGSKKDDWAYYNADYYYQCEDTKRLLQSAVADMTEKWEIPAVDTEAIEQNSALTLDGGFDFNSGWNFIYRNQVGRSSMTDETLAPPRDFKFFYKASIAPNAKDVAEAQKGSMTVSMGNDTRTVDIPFYLSRDSLKGQIFRASELSSASELASASEPASETDAEGDREYDRFLENITVFTRWYSFETGINNKFGNYVPEYF